MKSERILCAVLALLTVTSAFTSCANDTDEKKKKKETSKPVQTEEVMYEFEDRDYEGEDFKFLIYDKDNALVFYDEYIWSEGVTGNAISDAVTERNRRVGEKYNINITAEVVSSPNGAAQKRIQAGQIDFDVIYDWCIRLRPSALDGLYLNFEEFTFSDFTRDYWYPKAAEATTVMGKRYIAANYITMSPITWADMMYFNKDIMDKYSLDYPYDYVYNNTWTFDTFLGMLDGAYEDLDGNGKMNFGDQFATMSAANNMGFVCTAPIVNAKSDGTYEVIGYNEQMVSTYEKYKSILDKLGEGALTYDTVWSEGGDISEFDNQWSAARQIAFGAGQVMFLGGVMDYTKDFVDMEGTYGVCPNPVIEAHGNQFHTEIDYCSQMFAVPAMTRDIEKVDIILDYMGYESKNTLLPAYYETTLKTKRMEDTRDYDMLDTIRDSIEYSWVGMYWSDETSFRSKMLSSGNFASVWRKYGSKAQASLDELLDTIENLD